MKIILISDLHLSPNTLRKNQFFYKLLEGWQDIDALYILGDFFDYWIGDDDNNKVFLEIQNQLKIFAKQVPVFFLAGNHDFAVGKRFANYTGIKLIKDMTTIKVGINTILLSHGDAFCTLDKGYQRMKKILQNPFLVYILLKMPLKWRYKLKENLEHKAHKTENTKPQHIYNIVDSSVVTHATKNHANIVIHGHTHRPGHYQIIDKSNKLIERFEIPDWREHTAGGYIQIDGEKITIYNGD